jgi:parallel beta-helix repeat protein
MKKSQVLATTWLIGFPLGIIFIVSQFIISPPQGTMITNGGGDAHFETKSYMANPDSSSVNFLPVRADCDSEKIREITAEAEDKKGRRNVYIDCNVKLDPRYHRVTKRMIFEGPSATGVTLDCNDATIDGGKSNKVNYGTDMIEVRSAYTDHKVDDKVERRWQRPENVTIKNCIIKGSVRVWGMASNGEGSGSEYKTGKFVWKNFKKVEVESNYFKDSSKTRNHTIKARNNAPKNIVFDNVTITGVGRNPVYFAPGVTHSKLINSEIKGESEKVGIYLDAESAYNMIENNDIHVKTDEDDWGKLPFVTNRGWPQMAIDGSSRNKIINNRFSELRNGGIYLYRNCGEGGTIRHTPPEHNTIINNVFHYENYNGDKPAIYLSSRDYGFKERHPGHCDLDDGKPYGSSRSDKDFAKYNIIMQNQFYKRKIFKHIGGLTRLDDATLDDMIKTKNKSLNSPNYVDYNNNEMVDKERKRPAGCFIDGKRIFILHGKSFKDVRVRNGKSYSRHYSCDNGKLSYK